MKRTYKVGDVVYRGRRYWKSDNFRPGEVPGWNAEYVPFEIVNVTPKRLVAVHWIDGGASYDAEIQLNRQTMERDGKQHHSRYHEYFYAEIPKRQEPRAFASSPVTDAASLLGLTAPYTAEDVGRAFKRLARQHHPDVGGDAETFIKLKRARDAAMSTAGMSFVGRSVSGKWRCSCGASMELGITGNLGDIGAQIVDAFLGQHRAAGHHLTQTA